MAKGLRKIKCIQGGGIMYFHRWVSRFHNSNRDEYPVALVEKEDGTMVTIDYNQVQFVKEEN